MEAQETDKIGANQSTEKPDDSASKFSQEAFGPTEKTKAAEKVVAPETMDQRIQRSLGKEVFDHLSNKDKDWDWLIAHEDQLAKGLMTAAKDGDFHAFMTEVNRKCPHILFEENPRRATRGLGPHQDYIDTATVDWLVKMERGFLRSNDRLMNYVQWSDYTNNIQR